MKNAILEKRRAPCENMFRKGLGECRMPGSTRHEHEVDFLTLDDEVVSLVHRRAVKVLLTRESGSLLLQDTRDMGEQSSASRKHVLLDDRAVDESGAARDGVTKGGDAKGFHVITET